MKLRKFEAEKIQRKKTDDMDRFEAQLVENEAETFILKIIS
jgi:hypothetical protein